MLSILRRIYKSISFVTFLIALAYGILAVLFIIFPFKAPSYLSDFVITDKEHVQFILSFTIGGVFTLTIFTYTMVMNVLNRSISNYSPRLIPLILHERPHQLILGCTSGTIIYSLVLAIYISGEDNHPSPSLAASIAVIFVILCVLLFIYFIHSVSQSIHVNYVIRKSFNNTKRSIQNFLDMQDCLRTEEEPTFENDKVSFDTCGYLNKIRLGKLLAISTEHKISFKFEKKMGSFILENESVVRVSEPISKKIRNRIKKNVSIDRSEPIDVIEVGFKHLVEVAVKASSPAINDPGTALIAIDYLTQLFILYDKIPEFNCIKNSKGGCIYLSLTPKAVMKAYVFKEMGHYMKNDPILKEKLEHTSAILSKKEVA